MVKDLELELETALQALQAAAHLCRAVREEDAPLAAQKADRSPVTVADLASQALVARWLRQVFPNDPLVAEEEAHGLGPEANSDLWARVLAYVRRQVPEAASDDVLQWVEWGSVRDSLPTRFWTLDPIDGTKGFLRGDQYAVALALVVDREVVLGALACPNLSLSFGSPGPAGRGVILAAVRGQGAFWCPLEDLASRWPATVSTRGLEGPLRFCESVEAGHTSHAMSARVAEELGIATEAIRMDSQAKYALVATGLAEVYLRIPKKPEYREQIWDHAAGALIVTEAGGRVTDLMGHPLDFSQGIRLENNRGILASSGRVHDTILYVLQNRL
jgi:HAL2 family 3'(2'),5'-bisphosphate nucleotidase